METKLYEASLTGNVQALNALLQEDQLILDRISVTGFSETPLHIAAMGGHLHFAKVVLSLKPRLATVLDTQRRTPLHLASANGNLEMVQELLRVAGSDLCCSRDQDGFTPLHLAAMNEHLEVVTALIHANPDTAKEIPVTGETILHTCVRYNRFEALKLLIGIWDEEELAKLTDHAGNTLLHAAAVQKHAQIVNYLLKKPSIKANGNAINRHGLAPMDLLDQCPRDFKALETREILASACVSRANDLRNLRERLPSSTKSRQAESKWFISRAWARYSNNDDNQWLEKQRGILIVAALVVVGMAFHSGINPPGGTISDTINGRYELGNAVQTEVDMENFDRFVTYNTVTMVLSLAVVLLLISGFPVRNKFWMWVLTLATLAAMVCTVATYLQSLAMMSPDMYVNPTSIWFCLIWMLACGAMALIHTIFFVVWVVIKLSKCTRPTTETTKHQDPVEV